MGVFYCYFSVSHVLLMNLTEYLLYMLNYNHIGHSKNVILEVFTTILVVVSRNNVSVGDG